MIRQPQYNFNGKSRRVGMSVADGPKGGSLLSNFQDTSGGSEPQATNKQQTEQAPYKNNGTSASDGSPADGEDELSSTKAPSVTTSPRSARIRRPTPVPDISTGDGMGGSYFHIDEFRTPEQSKTVSSQVSSDEDTTPTKKDRPRPEDITPTVWKRTRSQTTKEHEEETQRMLKEKASTRVNAQHLSGTGFNTESIREQSRKLQPGSDWDTGGGRRGTHKIKTKFISRNRSNAQTKEMHSDPEGEVKEESKPENPKPSAAQPNKKFINPMGRYAFPEQVKEDISVQARASKSGFRNPQLEYPLPPKNTESQSGTDLDGYFPESQSTGFQDLTEKYKLPKTHETEKPRARAFVNPLSRKYNPSPEPEEEESQSQNYDIDESNDEITSIKGLKKGGSKKRKASKAIDLLTPKGKWMGQDDKLSSPDDTAEFSVEESQSSSQVRHMDYISLVLEETKLWEQAKKRKAKLETLDICVLCHANLPLGTLDSWRNDDGELKPIRMAEWTEICNKHKTVDLEKEWEKKGYPVIEWGRLKKRVEKYHQFLIDIVEDKVVSPFREVFATQQKETRGNAAMLLRRDVQLQYPGYYGPRGSVILLHEITVRLGSFIGDAAKKDRLIGQGGVGAFIQTVLVPELGVRLIMEDMNVSEFEARKTLDASREIGEKLHFDDFTEDIYDDEDGPWFDINTTQTPVAAKKKGLFGSSIIKD